MVLLFASALAMAMGMTMISTNQTLNVSDPLEALNEFLQGANKGFGVVVTSDALGACEESYFMAVYMTKIIVKNLFVNWEIDFAWIEGFFGMSYGGFLNDWKDACEPVLIQYGEYFGKAIDAYQTNKEEFLATVESNFNSNEVGIIETGITVASLIKDGDYYMAGFNFAGILSTLLSTWLPSGSN